ncbi:IclR family transcriptional regulator [Sodalis sp. RH21]|uniref:IclR family transcriptional regulator n=1 Tax=unclassified Sodalis (in: enterobacteria) TaxID=2636512 RepID=UPI0039B648CD
MPKVKSAERTFRLLELIANKRDGLSFSDMQSTLDIPRSSAHSLIQEFLDNDYLLYNSANKKYYAGVALIKMAANCIESTDLIQELNLLTQHLSQRLGKTSHAAILDGVNVVYLSKAQAKDDLSLMRNIGIHLPAHCTSVGKVLLSQYPDEVIARLYGNKPLEKMTVNSIGSLAVLLRDVQQARDDGYAIEQREANERAACIGMPIEQNGKTIAAFSITFLAYEWENLDVEQVLTVMRQGRTMIEQRLIRL